MPHFSDFVAIRCIRASIVSIRLAPGFGSARVRIVLTGRPCASRSISSLP